MDKLSQEKFDGIITKFPEYLDGEEIGFLRARRSYLSEQDEKKFASVLSDENPDHNPKVSPEVAKEVSEEKPKKKKK